MASSNSGQQPSSSAAAAAGNGGGGGGEEKWVGPLRSVPVSMIRYCIQKCQVQERLRAAGQPLPADVDPIDRRVTVHLDRGGFRYRADSLASIDDGVNLRLDRVVMSKVPRPRQKIRSRNHVAVHNRKHPTQQQQQGENPFPIASVPSTERVVGTLNSVMLPGASVVMIELPPSWGPLFEAQARLARKEHWRRYREQRAKIKQKRKQKRDEQTQRLKEKKAKRAAKEALLSKGAGAAGGGKKKPAGGKKP